PEDLPRSGSHRDVGRYEAPPLSLPRSWVAGATGRVRQTEELAKVATGRASNHLVSEPDESERREAALMRRLDRPTRQSERLHRDLTIAVEALALFIHYWLTLIPPLPESAQAAAQAKGCKRFAAFVETLGRRLAAGKNTLRDISLSTEIEKSASVAASGTQ